MTPLSILLPWPVSTNSMWRGLGSRTVLSAAARNWKHEAELMLAQQHPRAFKGPVEILLELSPPTKRAFDLDNRIKIVLDLLVKCFIVEADDMTCIKRITVQLGEEDFIGALVTISSWEGRHAQETIRGRNEPTQEIVEQVADSRSTR